MLLGIAAANLVAFSVLAAVVLRGVDLRHREELARDRKARATFVKRAGDGFVAFLSDADFANEVFRRTARDVLGKSYWAQAHDAYIANLVGTNPPLFGDFRLNLTGAPDPASERLRARNDDLVKLAFQTGVVQRRGDVVVVPLFESHETPTASGGVRSTRVGWGAAYVQVEVPPREEVDDPLTLRDVALAMGGATLAGMGLVYLLMLVLILRPLHRITAGALRISGGDFSRLVAETGRSEEIDQLIRTFNAMQVEIGQSRQVLEQRVSDAVARMRETEQRMVLTERLAAMGTLAAGIAHEINNPLGGMMNALNTLRRRGGSAETQERYLALVDDGLKRIRDVVARVLRFARSGGVRERVPLHDVIEDAARFVRHRLRDAHIALAVEVAPELTVRCDAAALGQVVLNLILNAADAIATVHQGGDGQIRVVADAQPGGLVRFSVIDNGPGMSAEVRARAFDHFYTTKAVGTGLGLSIVHQIVTEHGGVITIDSAPGEGTAVHVLL